MASRDEEKALNYRITFRRWATALLTIEAGSEDEAFDRVDDILEDADFNETYHLEVDHRYWVFDEPVEAHHVFVGPDEEEMTPGLPATWVIELERAGYAYFRVKAADRDAAIQAAEELMDVNERKYPVDHPFWSTDPDFELVDVVEISPSDWDAHA